MHFKNKVRLMAEWAASNNVIMNSNAISNFKLWPQIETSSLVQIISVNFTRAGVCIMPIERPGPNLILIEISIEA